jgi:hypothetical protein
MEARGGKLTLSCAVDLEIWAEGAVILRDSSIRTVWLDATQGLYALSNLGDAVVDEDWARGLAGVRSQHGGLAPAARRTGAFVCLVADEAGQCVHGVDLERRLYAFTTPAAQANGEGQGTMQGRGRCVETNDIPWPTDALEAPL